MNDTHYTEAERAEMARRPRYYGLVLPCGHALRYYNPAEDCMACFNISEAAQDCVSDADFADLEASYPRAEPDAPAEEI